MKLIELKSVIEKQLEITEDNILDKTRTTSSLYSRVLQLYFAEFRKLKTLNIELNKIYAKCYLDIKKHGYEGVEVGKSKGEIETFINIDNEYCQQLEKVNDSEIIVKYLESTLDNLNKVSFHIKNYIELKKIQMGIL